MKRVVVVLKDPASSLHYLRCQAPCGEARDGRWCMDMGGERGCYLGGYGTPEAARRMAESVGYEVAQ